ncbi:hypothetical protein [Natronomonas sp. LN261]|uniref:hypothetical protein n=1 Tax=Natronomonas sp. LN261 TaxID=2750669 RepID=UPI0015EF6201|nr:hypothetical protein [Natronomonas sp. LN261]
MSDSEPGRREVAYRLFAAEFDDAELTYSESDEERAPNYVVTPTGARVNRLFAVGVLTEVTDVNPEMVRGRLVDPTGAFVTYAGQYQPDALAVLERADPPGFFALSGKARTYEPDDGDRIYSSVRPESVSQVDAETRDRWVVTAAERTLERIGVMASAAESGLVGDQLRAALVEAGVDERLADGVALALDYYGTTPEYLDELRDVALDAVRVVAGEREEVRGLELAPGEGGGNASTLSTVDLAGAPTPGSAAAAAGVGEDEDGAGSDTDVGPAGEAADSEPTADAADEPLVDATDEPTSSSDATGDPPAEAPSEPTSTPEAGAESADAETADADTAEVDTADADTAEVDTEPDDAPDVDPEPVGEDVPDDTEAVDPGEFELDEAERREVEDEFGTEFSTADEIEPADIEPEGTAAEPTESAAADSAHAPSESDTATGSDGTADAEDTATPEAGVDLDEVVIGLMGELDDGDGADRDDLVAAVVEEYGADPEAVEDAIQEALMNGRCYEPSDDTLKRI